MRHSFKTLLASALFGALAASAALGQGIDGAPPPFDKGGVKVALVAFISGGDFFAAYQSGAESEARRLGIDLTVFPGRQDAAEQRSQIEQAINLGVAGIVIDHGQPEALQDLVQKALDAGIKVVAFDVDVANPAVPQIEQSDRELSRLAIEQIVEDNGKSFNAAYVYVPGFAPLDRRNAVWEAFRKENAGVAEKARFGVVNDTTAVSTADQAKAALSANPDVTVVYAPYDEFARGVKLAAQDLGIAGRLKIYSADVSTADIQEITEDGSPWTATVATNPAVVGAVSVRAAAKLIAGEAVPARITVEPALLTQDALRKAGVKTIEELAEKVPAFRSSSAVPVEWARSN